MKTLTVITPTYNRAERLEQLYRSLCRQTSDDFLWLMIDDGSDDGTEQLISRWKAENLIEIDYLHKANGGMHTALNLAYQIVETELNMVVDSDDWLTDDAIEKITAFWKRNRRDCFYGIVTNNIAPDGKLIGTALPPIDSCTTEELYGKYGVKGDKKMILRSDLSVRYPFPEIEGERYYPMSYKFRMLDQDYSLLVFPSATCVVDYSPDSMSYHKFEQYKTCCKGFSHYRNEMIRISSSPKECFRHAVHYIAESGFAKNRHYITECSKPGYVILALPVGLLYSAYLKRTNRLY